MTVDVYPSPREGALPFAAAILGIIVCIVALPVVLLLKGPFAGWALGTGLWVVNWTLAQMATRFSLGASPAAGVGVAGGSIMARAFLVVVVLYIVAIRISQPIGLTAAVIFLAAFSFDLMGRIMLFSILERTRNTPNHKGPADL
jgi:hypothetical protein